MTTTEYERLAAVVAPEIGAYILDGKDLPVALQSDTLACVHPTLDFHCKPILERAGRWRGRRPAICLNRDSIFDWASERVEPADLEAEANLLAHVTLAHELGHVAEREPPYYGPEPSPENEWLEAAVLWMAASRPAGEQREHRVTNYGLKPWFAHGLTFIRLALHLGYRIERETGVAIPAVLLGGGALYGLSQGGFYARALGNEPRKLRRLTLEQIKRISPPKAFRKLWQADVESWKRVETLRAIPPATSISISKE